VGERERSFEAFYAGAYPPVLRSLALALRDSSLAEEVAQEAFIRAFVRWHRVRAMERPQGWVYIVAVRIAFRRKRSEPSTDARVDIEPPFADTVVTRATVRAALEQLPERQRVAVVLRYLADLSLAEVADAMDIALGTVKSTLHAALGRLGVELSRVPEEVHDDAH
jgi:RNA polymerase sigma-70 factor (ECF subfamily)